MSKCSFIYKSCTVELKTRHGPSGRDDPNDWIVIIDDRIQPLAHWTENMAETYAKKQIDRIIEDRSKSERGGMFRIPQVTRVA